MGLEDLGQDSGPRVRDPVDFVSGTAPELDGGAIFAAVSVCGGSVYLSLGYRTVWPSRPDEGTAPLHGYSQPQHTDCLWLSISHSSS